MQLSETPSSFVDINMVRLLESAEILPNIRFTPAHTRLHPELCCTQEPIAGGWMFYGGPGSPLNHAVGMGLHGPVARDEFDRFEAFYRDRNTTAEIVLAPHVDRSVLDFVHERHYKLNEFNSVLWQRLTPEMHFADIPPGMEVRMVGHDESRTWANILVKGFADIAPVPPELFETFAFLPNSLCVLAYLNGEPVGGGGGAYFPEQGLCCLFGAATLPEFRRRGVQTAITATRLRMARDAGCKVAAVMTQPGSVSQKNSERLGFRVAYTKFVMIREWNDNVPAGKTS